MENITPPDESALNIDRIIEDIHFTRVALIKSLIQPDGLETYLEDHFDVMALSPIKSEFLKRDLKLLSESKMDLVHYSTLIRKVKESGSLPGLLIEDFIQAEIRTVVIKYIT